MPTQDEVLAFSRHIFSYAGGAVTMFAALHLITGGDAQSAADALSKISSGFAEIITGVASLTALASAIFATLSANPLLQFLRGSKAVAENPTIVTTVKVSDADQIAVAKAAVSLPKLESVIAAPEVANEIPSSAVQSSAVAEMVQKAKAL